MEITIPASSRLREALVTPDMFVEPSLTIYISDDFDETTVRRRLSQICAEEGVLSYRINGRIVDVVEEMKVTE